MAKSFFFFFHRSATSRPTPSSPNKFRGVAHTWLHDQPVNRCIWTAFTLAKWLRTCLARVPSLRVLESPVVKESVGEFAVLTTNMVRVLPAPRSELTALSMAMSRKESVSLRGMLLRGAMQAHRLRLLWVKITRFSSSILQSVMTDSTSQD